MILCRRCTLWKSLSEFTPGSRVCKACRSKANAEHYKSVVKPRRHAGNTGNMKARHRVEQAIARIDLGDSVGYACWRTGANVEAVEKELERRGAA